MKTKFLLVLGCIAGLAFNDAKAQTTEGTITRETLGTKKPIPVTISGFTGEVNSVLRFDLEVAGFDTTASSPTYFISGSNDGKVQGRVTDLSKTEILAKAYAGASDRILAHTLANEIISTITGAKGIALSKIAFKASKGRVSEIYVSDYDGYGAVAVTSYNSEVAMPAWVPGQRKLLYSSWKSGSAQIISHNLSSGTLASVANYGSGNYSPAISPDGRKIAMILGKSGSPDLYVANIDGSGLQQLTKTKEDESSPCWSPDGSTICYVSRHGTRPVLFTIPANGGQPKRLSVVGASNGTEPDWSPDGKWIAFSTANKYGFTLCVIPARGGDVTILVEGSDPAWAANSRTIIFTREQNYKRVLSLLDVPTKRVKDVAQISGSCSQACWSK